MNSIRKNGILLIMMLLSVSTIVAQASISGNIKDETGMPLPGVNVILDGTSKGAVSDFDGNYIIANVENGNYTLSATSIGYAKSSQDITIQDADIKVDIIMLEDAESLDEIIVTGVVNPKSKIESSVSVFYFGC